jgi:hypothetical protein
MLFPLHHVRLQGLDPRPILTVLVVLDTLALSTSLCRPPPIPSLTPDYAYSTITARLISPLLTFWMFPALGAFEPEASGRALLITQTISSPITRFSGRSGFAMCILAYNTSQVCPGGGRRTHRLMRIPLISDESSL